MLRNATIHKPQNPGILHILSIISIKTQILDADSFQFCSRFFTTLYRLNN